MNPNENNNSNQPNNFNFNSSSIGGNNFFNSQPNPSNNQNSNTSQPQITTTLNVPVTSPTHFDIIQQPAPIQNPSGQQPKNQNQEQKEEETYTKKDLKKFVVMSTVFGVLAILFLFIGLGGFILAFSKSDQLAKTEKIVATQKSIINAVEESSGISPISSPEKVPVYQTTLGYIYISDWHIKLKVPDNLKNLSYILNQQKYRPSICFNGLSEGVQTSPAFASVITNPGGMGCLSRIETRDGNTDTNTGKSFGTLVFTHEGFNYFYIAPEKDFSTDASELGLEKTAVQLIKNMISNQISSYE